MKTKGKKTAAVVLEITNQLAGFLVNLCGGSWRQVDCLQKKASKGLAVALACWFGEHCRQEFWMR
jgi:hypothetical protein